MDIKFLAFYDIPNSVENRIYALSSVNLINYISEILIQNGNSVHILSPATTRNLWKFYKSKTIKLSDNYKLSLGPTYNTNINIINFFLKLYTRIWYLLYLYKNLKKNDIIFVYHTIPISEIIRLFFIIIRKRNIKVVYYIGELYQLLYADKMKFTLKIRCVQEIKMINKANYYILSTGFIENYTGKLKPHSILPGILKPCINKLNNKKFSDIDKRIHIVYAGIINDSKGVWTLLDVAHHLDDKYVIHILGYSLSDTIIKNLKNKVEENNTNCKCELKYEGVLIGDEFEEFLSSCNIGICPQQKNTYYNDSAFPSKILTYLRCNLYVICTEIDAVKYSPVGRLVSFVEEDSPYAFAEAIRNANIANFITNIENELNNLHMNFESELLSILGGNI